MRDHRGFPTAGQRVTGWPYVTWVDGNGVHRTGPWLPWRCTLVRAAATVTWVVTTWMLSGSALLAGLAASLACWAWRATR